MAKTTVTKATLPIIDIVRSKPKLIYLEIPKYRADVVIEVTTTGKLSKPKEVPSTAMNRLKAAAEAVMLDYEKIIKEEAVRLDKKIGELMQEPTKKNVAAAQQMIADSNMSIKNALASAEPAAQKAVEKTLKAEAQKDKLLKEARVKTTVKCSLGVIKIGASVAKLIATSGAEITSYKTIVVEVAKLGLEINQQLKNEAKLRKDLQKGLADFLKLRETSVQQAIDRQGLGDIAGNLDYSKPMAAIKGALKSAKDAGEEVTQGRDLKSIAAKIMDFSVKKIKSNLADVEKARVAYREHTTKTRHRADKLGASADKLMKAMKSNRTLKEGVKIGAKCMDLKRAGSAMNKKLAEREAFLVEIQEVMKGNGLEIDDRTTIQKIKELEKLTILEEGKGVLDAIKDIKGLVDNVVEAAA
jgi:hypothetical protein